MQVATLFARKFTCVLLSLRVVFSNMLFFLAPGDNGTALSYASVLAIVVNMMYFLLVIGVGCMVAREVLADMEAEKMLAALKKSQEDIEGPMPRDASNKHGDSRIEVAQDSKHAESLTDQTESFAGVLVQEDRTQGQSIELVQLHSPRDRKHASITENENDTDTAPNEAAQASNPQATNLNSTPSQVNDAAASPSAAPTLRGRRNSSPWVRKRDVRSRRFYYAHEITKQTVWKEPPEGWHETLKANATAALPQDGTLDAKEESQSMQICKFKSVSVGTHL